jgi:alpha-glucuronidase
MSKRRILGPLGVLTLLLVSCGNSSSGKGDLTGTSGGSGGSTHEPPVGGTSAAGGNTGSNTGGSSVVTGGSGGQSETGGSVSEEYPKPATPPADEDGSKLWLRYVKVPIAGRLADYQAAFTSVLEVGDSPTLKAAEDELVQGLTGLTGQAVASAAEPDDGAVVVGTPESSSVIASLSLGDRLTAVGSEGYLVEAATTEGKKVTVVAANSEVGALYGSYALLRHLQCHRSVAGLALSASPKIQHRLLDHWDNLDGTVERGYAGRSLWAWSSLPGTLSARYKDYARASASIGINGAVLTNVNADAQVLTSEYLDKVKALADTFRAYGIAVYLTARFSAPVEIGSLSTADPLDSNVKQWWRDKATDIYEKIPDFGGFLVKANAEGQPGPQDYGRSHADGANMLAQAVAPHGGIVMWRAFVYSSESPVDRIRQAYEEFKPLDGKFDQNVLVQVKNGPLDFQPREPFSPLFGAMPKTPLALELQVTKEYLGEDTHLAYLGPLYEEVLKSDTYASGAGSTVAHVIDGTLHGYTTTAIAGVSNVGSDTNWTGSHFNQANWYVFGRMAWDPALTAQAVADEWIRQTFSNDPAVVTPVTKMMMDSRQALVNYMTPLGLAHIMGTDHHYGPAPWVDDQSRAEWNPVYYHKADASGIGFDRTSTGSDAVAQYAVEVGDKFASLSTVTDDFLLFFHHVGWQDQLDTGRSLWEELVYRYSLGVDSVGVMRDTWATVQGRIDTKRFNDVDGFLEIQHYEARWWRDACLQYFRTFANLEIPAGYSPPAKDLSYYKGLNCPTDATKPRCPAVYTGSPSPAILP